MVEVINYDTTVLEYVMLIWHVSPLDNLTNTRAIR